ncbi:MAG: ATP-binding protein, partial [Deltaproteobacteria bacterium]|nr:ATP-binding protein [Deltaproteobacteria bacterium]
MIPVNEERDIVTARNSGRALCAEVGFGMTDQVKVATAISELARNIVLYAGSGRIELREITADAKGIEIVARDDGPGIDNLDVVLAGAHRSKKGLGLGLLGTKRLMDYFDVETGPG